MARQWNFLIRGPNTDPDVKHQNPDKAVITGEQWRQLLFASQSIEQMAKLSEAISTHFEDWKLWIQHGEPHAAALPFIDRQGKEEERQSWDSKLTPFLKMLLLKIFRKEKLLFAFEMFVSATMASTSVSRHPSS